MKTKSIMKQRCNLQRKDKNITATAELVVGSAHPKSKLCTVNLKLEEDWIEMNVVFSMEEGKMTRPMIDPRKRGWVYKQLHQRSCL